ncbi:hypothetical protein K435DRAFT_888150 [Dendrothele bispora CBS 962.96]|uniref:Cytochrome P450 n=1 Tax=Dendrothele bispora (strain CBS 962.96) TaxID=1314807 RepID=A0A4S8KRD0_DENBC|nr:hypothetical protein K435DRAFT_888150 [Dendrothele bispora CBS 962.96]
MRLTLSVVPQGPILYDQFGSLLGSGVFNSDGEMWKFHRTVTRPFFSKECVSDYDIFDRHAEGIIKAMKKRVGDGGWNFAGTLLYFRSIL